MSAKLTDRDVEVLRELEAACRYLARYGREWVQPLDCGGTDGSDHSYRLSKLAARGLAEARQRGGGYRGSRGSKQYKITDAGRSVLQSTTPVRGE